MHLWTPTNCQTLKGWSEILLQFKKGCQTSKHAQFTFYLLLVCSVLCSVCIVYHHMACGYHWLSAMRRETCVLPLQWVTCDHWRRMNLILLFHFFLFQKAELERLTSPKI